MPLKKEFLLTCFACFLVLQSAFTQEVPIDSAYSHYFEDTREIPYLHLNKSVFLTGEEVWFQAYVIEQNSKKLHPTTSNLYVTVFSSKGELKEQKLIAIKKGIGAGSILLDSTYTDSYYFIKASTRWMKNFKEDNAYVNRIQIASNSTVSAAKQVKEEDFFDFQIFPEGGHFVENTINSAGILIKDKNGKGQRVLSGFVKNGATGDTIQTFATNRFGTGNLTLFYEKDSRYILEAELENGSVISKKLDPAKSKGINLIVKNPNTRFVEITLATNAATLTDIIGKTYSIWIHNTKTYYKREITFSTTQKNKTLFIKNDKLFKGTNIITIFNENNVPILERVIFNYSEDLFVKPVVTQKLSTKDSTSISIEHELSEKAYISASFLPISTLTNTSKVDIYGKFLLEPFVKGTIENAAYYFTDVNRKKLGELDQLLLTQGWSRYNWNDIFEKPKKKIYPFENGIDITVQTNQKIRKKQRIFMYSEENNLVQNLNPNQNPYTLKNSFVIKNSEILFALMYGDNYFKLTPSLSYSSSKLFENIKSSELQTPLINELSLSNYKVLPNTIEELEGIELKTKVDKYENEPVGAALSLRYIDPKSLIAQGYTVDEYIRNQIIFYQNLSRPLGGVFLNGERVRGSQDVEGISMDQVREIRFGDIPGIGNKLIFLYTYSNYEYLKMNNIANFKKIKIPVGFDKVKEYYQPNYQSFLDKNFRNYGAVSWKHSLTVKPKEALQITIPNSYQEVILMLVEGVTENGGLMHFTLRLNTE